MLYVISGAVSLALVIVPIALTLAVGILI